MAGKTRSRLEEPARPSAGTGGARCGKKTKEREKSYSHYEERKSGQMGKLDLSGNRQASWPNQ